MRTMMSLGALIHPNGSHPASWLVPGAEDGASNDVGYYQRMARLAEKGLFDLFFIADTPAARTDNLRAWSRSPVFMNVFDPIVLLAAVAGATQRIGLGATASTSFSEPYTIARQFASLDHISGGRAGWNVVTSANDYAARNFGLDRLPPHAERYARAREFVHLVRDLWDTWEDDAFVYNHEAGLSFDPARFRVTHHEGAHFRLHGALNLARPPQGHPVIIQAGASEAGKELAAETAEIVFGSAATLEKAKEFYRDLKGRMARHGRPTRSLRILSGISVVVAETEQAARESLESWQALIHPDVGILRLGQDLETDLSDLPLDEPVPENRIPATSNLHQGYFAEIADMIRSGLTLRQIGLRYNRSKATFCGTPVSVADHMQTWIEEEACDGFMISFPVLPGTLETFVDTVVPELQRRGLFRTGYDGSTLRDVLGLERPAPRPAR